MSIEPAAMMRNYPVTSLRTRLDVATNGIDTAFDNRSRGDLPPIAAT
jgi:hypothetical protein